MEARASFSGASVSKTVVAAFLVIAVMCLIAVGGYLIKGGLNHSGAAATQSQAVYAAPGTILRQDDWSRSAKATDQQGAAVPERSTGHRELP